MTQRELRETIFSILFEKQLMEDMDIAKRLNEIISENNLSASKIEFLTEYVNQILEQEKYIIDEINKYLNGWSYKTLGIAEAVILKIAFYEILIKKVGYQIVINEALLLAEEYGDNKSKEFINGVLADLVN